MVLFSCVSNCFPVDISEVWFQSRNKSNFIATKIVYYRCPIFALSFFVNIFTSCVNYYSFVHTWSNSGMKCNIFIFCNSRMKYLFSINRKLNNISNEYHISVKIFHFRNDAGNDVNLNYSYF